ncbi:hypothetical protein [Micromonospora wenchangensis]|uniref:hypothetical protein n=1 Tax=Micromonospora wenchangensis TaxID=1185415 RepID=UPI00344A0C08
MHDVPGRPGSIALLPAREWDRLAGDPRLPDATDTVTVLVHGAGDRFRVPLRHPDGRTSDTTLTADELHTLLESPERDGRRLALLSCAAGRTGARAVQRLADLRATDVVAPEGDLVVTGTAGHLPLSVDGRPWALFVPDGTGAWDVVNDEIADPAVPDPPFAAPFAGYASRAGTADVSGVRLTNAPLPPTEWDRVRIVGDGLCLLSAVAVAVPEAMTGIVGMPPDALDRLLRVRRTRSHDVDLGDVDAALREEIRRRVADPSPTMVELFNHVATTWLFPEGHDVQATLLDVVDTWDWRRPLPVEDGTAAGGRAGDVLPLVIGAALGRPVWQGRVDPPSATVLWPDGTGEPVRLLYNGRDHYDAWVPAAVAASDDGRAVERPDSGKGPGWLGVLRTPRQRGVLWPWDGDDESMSMATLIRQVDAVDLPGEHLLVLLADENYALLFGDRVPPGGVLGTVFAGGPPGARWVAATTVDPRAPMVLTVVSDNDEHAVAFGRAVERELRHRLDVGLPTPSHLSVVTMSTNEVPIEPVRLPRLRFRLPAPPPGQLSQVHLADLPARIRQAYVTPPGYTEGTLLGAAAWREGLPPFTSSAAPEPVVTPSPDDAPPTYGRVQQDRRHEERVRQEEEFRTAAARQAERLAAEVPPDGPVRRVTVPDTGLADGLGGHRGWLLHGGWPPPTDGPTGADPVELAVAVPNDAVRLVRVSLPAVEDQPALEVQALVEPPGAAVDVEPHLLPVLSMWRNDFTDGPVAQPILDPPEMVRRAWLYLIDDTEQTEAATIRAERGDDPDAEVDREMLRARVLATVRETFWETFGESPAYAAGLTAMVRLPGDMPLPDYWTVGPVRELIMRYPWRILSTEIGSYVQRFGWRNAHRIVLQPGVLDGASDDVLVTPDGVRHHATDYLARLAGTDGGSRVLILPDLDHATAAQSAFVRTVRASVVVVLPTLLPVDVQWTVSGSSAGTGTEVDILVGTLDEALARAVLHAADPVEGRRWAEMLLADPDLRVGENGDWLTEIFDSAVLTTPYEPVRFMVDGGEPVDAGELRSRLRDSGVMLVDPYRLPEHRVLIEITDPRPELVQYAPVDRGGTRLRQLVVDGSYAAEHPDTWRVVDEPWSRIQSWLAILDPDRTYPWDPFLLALAYRDGLMLPVDERTGAWPGAGHRFVPVHAAALAEVREVFAGRSPRDGVIWTTQGEPRGTLLLVDEGTRVIVDYPMVHLVPRPTAARAAVTVPDAEDLHDRGLVVAVGQLDGDRLTGDGWEVTADELIDSEALRAHPRVVLLDRSPPVDSPFVQRLLAHGVGVLAPDAELAGWTAVYQLPGWQVELTGPDSADLLRRLRAEFDSVVLGAATAHHRTPAQTGLVRAAFDLLGRPYGQEVVDGHLHLHLDRWATAEAFAADAGRDGILLLGGPDRHGHDLTLRVPVEQVRVFPHWSGEQLYLVTADPATVAPVTDLIRDRLATAPVVRWTPDLGRAARAADVGSAASHQVSHGGLPIAPDHVGNLVETVDAHPSWRTIAWTVDAQTYDDAEALVWLGAGMAALELPVDDTQTGFAVAMPSWAVPAVDRYDNGVVLWSPGRTGLPAALRAAFRVAVAPVSELDDVVDGVRAGDQAADAVALLMERLPEGTRIVVVPGEFDTIQEIPVIFDSVFAVVVRSEAGDPGTWTGYWRVEGEQRIAVLTGTDLSYVIAGLAAEDPQARPLYGPGPQVLALPQAAVRFLVEATDDAGDDGPPGARATDVAFVAADEITAADHLYTLPPGAAYRVVAPGPDGEVVLQGWAIDGETLAAAGHDLLVEDEGPVGAVLASELAKEQSPEARTLLLELAHLVGIGHLVTDNPLRRHGLGPVDRTFVPDWVAPVGVPVGPAWWVGTDVVAIEITAAAAGQLPARQMLAWDVEDPDQLSNPLLPPQLMAVPYRDGPLVRLLPDQIWALGLGPLLGERGILVEPGTVTAAGVTTGRPDGRGALPAAAYRAILPETNVGIPVVVFLDHGPEVESFARALAAQAAVALVRTDDGLWRAHHARPGTGDTDELTDFQAFRLVGNAVAAVTADLAELTGLVNTRGRELGSRAWLDGVGVLRRLSGLPVGTARDRAELLASALFGLDRLRAAVDGEPGGRSVGHVLTRLGLPGLSGPDLTVLARRLGATPTPVTVAALGLLPANAVAPVWRDDAVALVHRAPDGALTLVLPDAGPDARLTALDPDELPGPLTMLLDRGRTVAVRVATGERVLGGQAAPDRDSDSDSDSGSDSGSDSDPGPDQDQDQGRDREQNPDQDPDPELPSEPYPYSYWIGDSDSESGQDPAAAQDPGAGEQPTPPGTPHTAPVSTGSPTDPVPPGPSTAAVDAVGEALRRLPAARLASGRQVRRGRPSLTRLADWVDAVQVDETAASTASSRIRAVAAYLVLHGRIGDLTVTAPAATRLGLDGFHRALGGRPVPSDVTHPGAAVQALTRRPGTMLLVHDQPPDAPDRVFWLVADDRDGVVTPRVVDPARPGVFARSAVDDPVTAAALTRAGTTVLAVDARGDAMDLADFLAPSPAGLIAAAADPTLVVTDATDLLRAMVRLVDGYYGRTPRTLDAQLTVTPETIPGTLAAALGGQFEPLHDVEATVDALRAAPGSLALAYLPRAGESGRLLMFVAEPALATVPAQLTVVGVDVADLSDADLTAALSGGRAQVLLLDPTGGARQVPGRQPTAEQVTAVRTAITAQPLLIGVPHTAHPAWTDVLHARVTRRLRTLGVTMPTARPLLRALATDPTEFLHHGSGHPVRVGRERRFAWVRLVPRPTDADEVRLAPGLGGIEDRRTATVSTSAWAQPQAATARVVVPIPAGGVGVTLLGGVLSSRAVRTIGQSLTTGDNQMMIGVPDSFLTRSAVVVQVEITARPTPPAWAAVPATWVPADGDHFWFRTPEVLAMMRPVRDGDPLTVGPAAAAFLRDASYTTHVVDDGGLATTALTGIPEVTRRRGSNLRLWRLWGGQRAVDAVQPGAAGLTATSSSWLRRPSYAQGVRPVLRLTRLTPVGELPESALLRVAASVTAGQSVQSASDRGGFLAALIGRAFGLFRLAVGPTVSVVDRRAQALAPQFENVTGQETGDHVLGLYLAEYTGTVQWSMYRSVTRSLAYRGLRHGPRPVTVRTLLVVPQQQVAALGDVASSARPDRDLVALLAGTVENDPDDQRTLPDHLWRGDRLRVGRGFLHGGDLVAGLVAGRLRQLLADERNAAHRRYLPDWNDPKVQTARIRRALDRLGNEEHLAAQNSPGRYSARLLGVADGELLIELRVRDILSGRTLEVRIGVRRRDPDTAPRYLGRRGTHPDPVTADVPEPTDSESGESEDDEPTVKLRTSQGRAQAATDRTARTVATGVQATAAVGSDAIGGSAGIGLRAQGVWRDVIEVTQGSQAGVVGIGGGAVAVFADHVRLELSASVVVEYRGYLVDAWRWLSDRPVHARPLSFAGNHTVDLELGFSVPFTQTVAVGQPPPVVLPTPAGGPSAGIVLREALGELLPPEVTPQRQRLRNLGAALAQHTVTHHLHGLPELRTQLLDALRAATADYMDAGHLPGGAGGRRRGTAFSGDIPGTPLHQWLNAFVDQGHLAALLAPATQQPQPVHAPSVVVGDDVPVTVFVFAEVTGHDQTPSGAVTGDGYESAVAGFAVRRSAAERGAQVRLEAGGGGAAWRAAEPAAPTGPSGATPGGQPPASNPTQPASRTPTQPPATVALRLFGRRQVEWISGETVLAAAEVERTVKHSESRTVLLGVHGRLRVHLAVVLTEPKWVLPDRTFTRYRQVGDVSLLGQMSVEEYRRAVGTPTGGWRLPRQVTPPAVQVMHQTSRLVDTPAIGQAMLGWLRGLRLGGDEGMELVGHDRNTALNVSTVLHHTDPVTIAAHLGDLFDGGLSFVLRYPGLLGRPAVQIIVRAVPADVPARVGELRAGTGNLELSTVSEVGGGHQSGEAVTDEVLPVAHLGERAALNAVGTLGRTAAGRTGDVTVSRAVTSVETPGPWLPVDYGPQRLVFTAHRRRQEIGRHEMTVPLRTETAAEHLNLTYRPVGPAAVLPDPTEVVDAPLTVDGPAGPLRLVTIPTDNWRAWRDGAVALPGQFAALGFNGAAALQAAAVRALRIVGSGPLPGAPGSTLNHQLMTLLGRTHLWAATPHRMAGPYEIALTDGYRLVLHTRVTSVRLDTVLVPAEGLRGGGGAGRHGNARLVARADAALPDTLGTSVGYVPALGVSVPGSSGQQESTAHRTDVLVGGLVDEGAQAKVWWTTETVVVAEHTDLTGTRRTAVQVTLPDSQPVLVDQVDVLDHLLAGGTSGDGPVDRLLVTSYLEQAVHAAEQAQQALKTWRELERIALVAGFPGDADSAAGTLALAAAGNATERAEAEAAAHRRWLEARAEVERLVGLAVGHLGRGPATDPVAEPARLPAVDDTDPAPPAGRPGPPRRDDPVRSPVERPDDPARSASGGSDAPSVVPTPPVPVGVDADDRFTALPPPTDGELVDVDRTGLCLLESAVVSALPEVRELLPGAYGRDLDEIQAWRDGRRPVDVTLPAHLRPVVLRVAEGLRARIHSLLVTGRLAEVEQVIADGGLLGRDVRAQRRVRVQLARTVNRWQADWAADTGDYLVLLVGAALRRPVVLATPVPSARPAGDPSAGSRSAGEAQATVRDEAADDAQANVGGWSIRTVYNPRFDGAEARISEGPVLLYLANGHYRAWLPEPDVLDLARAREEALDLPRPAAGLWRGSTDAATIRSTTTGSDPGYGDADSDVVFSGAESDAVPSDAESDAGSDGAVLGNPGGHAGVARPAGRGRHPLTLAGLETAVQETLDVQAAVRPAGSVTDWRPLEDPLSCLALARRFAAVLHPGIDGFVRPGLRVGRTRDDAAIGTRWAGDFAGDRSDWAVVDSWTQIERALVAAAPGTAAFVLLERPGSAPGHAFVGYRLDRETDPVRWVQFGGERGAALLPGAAADNRLPRLNALGPEVAARAVLVDPEGTVDPAALVDAGTSVPVASTSVARAIVDAPVNRTFLGHGSEFEFFETLDLSAAAEMFPGATDKTLPDLARTSALAEDPAGTTAIEVEVKTYFRDSDDGKLYRRPAPKRTEEVAAILEVIVGVVPDTDAEMDAHHGGESLYPAMTALGQALSALTGPVPFAQLLGTVQAAGHLSQVVLTPLGRKVNVGPRPPDSEPGARVHHSIGVPLAGAHSFLRYVARHTWRSPTSVSPSYARPHLQDALSFADTVAEHFADGGGSPRDVAELRGFATVLYSNTAGVAGRWLHEGLVKENVAALSRQDMRMLLDSLSPSAQAYFQANFTGIAQLFRRMFTDRIPDLEERFKARNGAELAGDFFRNIAFVDKKNGNKEQSIIDYLRGDVRQHLGYGGMTVIDGFDTSNGALPLMVLEVRYFGAQHVDGATAQAEAAALRREAGAAFDEALQVTGTTVERPGGVQLALPDRELWPMWRHAGPPGLLTVELPLYTPDWSLRPLLPVSDEVTAIRVVQHVGLPEHYVFLQRLADLTGRPVYTLAEEATPRWDPDVGELRVDWPDGTRPWLEFLPALYDADSDRAIRRGIDPDGVLVPLDDRVDLLDPTTVHLNLFPPDVAHVLPPLLGTEDPDVLDLVPLIQATDSRQLVFAGPDAPTYLPGWATTVVETVIAQSTPVAGLVLVGHPLPHAAAQTLVDVLGQAVAERPGLLVTPVVLTHGADIDISTRAGAARMVSTTDGLGGWRVFRPDQKGRTSAVPADLRAVITAPPPVPEQPQGTADPLLPGPDGVEDAPPRPDPGTVPRGEDEPLEWTIRRAMAQVAVREHHWVDPVSRPGPARDDRYEVVSRFEARRFLYGGQPVTDLTVRVWLDGDNGRAMFDALERGVHRVFNSGADTTAYRLPNGFGDLLHVTVERAASPQDAHLRVQVIDEGPTDQFHWRHDALEEELVHEFAHQLGLREEYRDDTAPHRPNVPGSLLGDLAGLPADALSDEERAALSDEEKARLRDMRWAGLRSRHLHLLAALVGEPDADGEYRAVDPVRRPIGVAPFAPQTTTDQPGRRTPAAVPPVPPVTAAQLHRTWRTRPERLDVEAPVRIAADHAVRAVLDRVELLHRPWNLELLGDTPPSAAVGDHQRLTPAEPVSDWAVLTGPTRDAIARRASLVTSWLAGLPQQATAGTALEFGLVLGVPPELLADSRDNAVARILADAAADFLRAQLDARLPVGMLPVRVVVEVTGFDGVVDGVREQIRMQIELSLRRVLPGPAYADTPTSGSVVGGVHDGRDLRNDVMLRVTEARQALEGLPAGEPETAAASVVHRLGGVLVRLLPVLVTPALAAPFAAHAAQVRGVLDDFRWLVGRWAQQWRTGDVEVAGLVTRATGTLDAIVELTPLIELAPAAHRDLDLTPLVDGHQLDDTDHVAALARFRAELTRLRDTTGIALDGPIMQVYGWQLLTQALGALWFGVTGGTEPVADSRALGAAAAALDAYHEVVGGLGADTADLAAFDRAAGAVGALAGRLRPRPDEAATDRELGRLDDALAMVGLRTDVQLDRLALDTREAMLDGLLDAATAALDTFRISRDPGHGALAGIPGAPGPLADWMTLLRTLQRMSALWNGGEPDLPRLRAMHGLAGQVRAGIAAGRDDFVRLANRESPGGDPRAVSNRVLDAPAAGARRPATPVRSAVGVTGPGTVRPGPGQVLLHVVVEVPRGQQSGSAEAVSTDLYQDPATGRVQVTTGDPYAPVAVFTRPETAYGVARGMADHLAQVGLPPGDGPVVRRFVVDTDAFTAPDDAQVYVFPARDFAALVDRAEPGSLDSYAADPETVDDTTRALDTLAAADTPVVTVDEASRMLPTQEPNARHRPRLEPAPVTTDDRPAGTAVPPVVDRDAGPAAAVAPGTVPTGPVLTGTVPPGAVLAGMVLAGVGLPEIIVVPGLGDILVTGLPGLPVYPPGAGSTTPAPVPDRPGSPPRRRQRTPRPAADRG